MLDAVYFDTKSKSIVAVRPKPPFKPIFQVAACKEGSGIRIVNEPFLGSSVFVVEAGESRTLRIKTELAVVFADFLDQLVGLGEIAQRIREALPELASSPDGYPQKRLPKP